MGMTNNEPMINNEPSRSGNAQLSKKLTVASLTAKCCIVFHVKPGVSQGLKIYGFGCLQLFCKRPRTLNRPNSEGRAWYDCPYASLTQTRTPGSKEATQVGHKERARNPING
eukprot:1179020-Prorocentrum_minimum.AAC.3